MNFGCGVASKLMRRCDSQLPAQPVIMQHHLNKEPLMKPKLISLSGIAAAAIAASSICVIGTVRAQTDTGIGTNPHLRSQSAGAPAASPGAVVKMSQKDVSFIQSAGENGQQEVENGKL